MKYIIILTLLSVSCAHNKERSSSIQVFADIDEILKNADRRSIRYYVELPNNCQLGLQAEEQYGQKSNWFLQLRIREQKNCHLNFSDQRKYWSAILSEIFKQWDERHLVTFITPSMKSIQSSGLWNLPIVNKAIKSEEWTDYAKNYPKHKSKKSSNSIFLDLYREAIPNKEFIDFFKEEGIHLKLASVEKVFALRPTPLKKELNNLPINSPNKFRLPFDAGMFHYKVLKK